MTPIKAALLTLAVWSAVALWGLAFALSKGLVGVVTFACAVPIAFFAQRGRARAGRSIAIADRSANGVFVRAVARVVPGQ